MAIITDPDLLSRYDVIFTTTSQKVSIYPVGETQRNTSVTYTNVYVDTVGTIVPGGTENFNTDGVVAGDVVAIQNGPDGGHYYVRVTPTAGANNPASLAEIDTGTAGVETTGLTIQTSAAFDGTTAVDDAAETITITTHGYVTGDAVIYDNGTGTTITGLTQLGTYYVNRIDADTISLHTTYANAVADTDRINLTDTGTSGLNVLHDRLIVGIFNNGASTSEQILGNATSGIGDGDVLDGITLQAIYSFGKEEWRVDSLVGDIPGNNYNDDLIRHEFPYEAITSEQFEIGGGAAHDAWNWFNEYTRKKVRTAGWAEKNNASANDLARQTGIITLGSLDADSQVYYQQVSEITTKEDFTFLGPVNEALQVQRDDNQNLNFADGSDFDRTTFLKLFVRKKGRTYAGSEIADIGVSVIGTIVNRFPLSHVIDAAITLTDAQILGTNLYRFAITPVGIVTGADGDTQAVGGIEFLSAGSTFQTSGVIPGDILEIASGTIAVQGFYEIVTVTAETTLEIREAESVTGNDFTFNIGFTADETSLVFAIYSSVLVPDAGGTGRTTGVLTDETATGIIDASGITGTLTDSGRNFTTDGVAAGDILEITNFYDLDFNANTEVDAVTADTITFSGAAAHNLRTGDRVVYNDNGLTSIAELTSGAVYYIARESATRFYLCATLADAWLREQGAATQITLTPGVAETHTMEVIEGQGCYPIDTVGTTTLTIDTTDYKFPTISQVGTTYRVREAGMYLQFKDKTVQQLDGTTVDAAGDLTDLDITGGNTITITGGVFDYLNDSGGTVNVAEGDVIELSGTPLSDGRYTVLSRTSSTVVVVKETIVNDVTVGIADAATVSVKQGFTRTIGTGDFSFGWKVSGNGAGLQDVFQYVQLELRRDTDIDCGPGAFVGLGNTGPIGFTGNVNDLLMAFASPTGTGLNMFIDGLDSNDINNATFNDHTGTARNFPFTAAGSLVFNPNLTNDASAKYWLFFSNDDAGDNLGRDYGTEYAIIVDTATDNQIAGEVNGTQHIGGIRTVNSGTTSISFTYAYDTNIQRGSASAATNAPVTLVAIGLDTAQFVITTGTITQATGITISAVAALERNYTS